MGYYEDERCNKQVRIIETQAKRIGYLKYEVIELTEEKEVLEQEVATLKEDNKRWFYICKHQLEKINELKKLLEAHTSLYTDEGLKIDVEEGAVVITVRR